MVLIPPNVMHSLALNWDPTWQGVGACSTRRVAAWMQTPSGVDAGWPVPLAASAWMQEDLSHVPCCPYIVRISTHQGPGLGLVSLLTERMATLAPLP